MDKAPANSRRVHFLLTGTTTPQLIVGNGNRHALVLVNESSALPIHIGHSGTVRTIGLYVGAGRTVEHIGGAYGCQLTKADRRVHNFVSGGKNKMSKWTTYCKPKRY